AACTLSSVRQRKLPNKERHRSLAYAKASPHPNALCHLATLPILISVRDAGCPARDTSVAWPDHYRHSESSLVSRLSANPSLHHASLDATLGSFQSLLSLYPTCTCSFPPPP